MAPWPHYPNKNVFSDRRNLLYDKSVPFACDGGQFHTPGAAAANPLSSKVSTSQLTMHVRHLVDRTYSRRWRTSAKRRRPLARYDGEMSDSDRWTSVATLKSTLWRNGSQCSWRSTGVMWSERRVPVMRLAAAFWTDCDWFTSPSEIHTEEQSCSSVGARRSTNAWINVLLASSDNDRRACRRSWRSW